MKPLLLCVAVLLATLKGNTQFVLKPDGFETANGGNYFIVEVPDKSQQELFKEVKNKIMANYGAFYDQSRITTNTSDEITLKTVDKKRLVYYEKNFDISFQIRIEFKEGRIKVNAPVIQTINNSKARNTAPGTVLYVRYPGKTVSFNGNGFTIVKKDLYVFDRKGKLKNKQLQQLLETAFNDQILPAILPAKDRAGW